MVFKTWLIFNLKLPPPLLLLLHQFNSLFSRTTWVSWYQKVKTSLDLNQARDDGVLGCSGINWTTCKQCAPRSRQITTPNLITQFFTGRMLFLMPNLQSQSTEGKVLGVILITWKLQVQLSPFEDKHMTGQ